MRNAVNWFEIPALQFDRAVRFYNAILEQPLRTEHFMGMPHGIFSADEEAVAGAVVLMPHYQPSEQGSVIYLNVGNGLDAVLSRVAEAGGEILMLKTDIGPQGFIAQIRDTEGNKVGLHQPA